MSHLSDMYKSWDSDLPNPNLHYEKCLFCGRLTIHDKINGEWFCRWRGEHSPVHQKIVMDKTMFSFEFDGKTPLYDRCPGCKGKKLSKYPYCYDCRVVMGLIKK